MGIRQRLENLVSNPRVVEVGTDLAFIQGLLDHYNNKRSLTAGRREWLGKLEEKYSDENSINPLDNEIGRRLQAVLSNERVTARDRSFAESLKNQWVRWQNLSEKQLNALLSLEGRYSEEGRQKLENWKAEYSGLVKQKAEIAARYYLANPPYYGDLAARIIEEADFVPTERQYNKMVNNKYAQKVIEATLSEPLYPVNKIVEARSGTAGQRLLRGAKAFVLKVNPSPVTNAAKGSKKYLVLPIGAATPVTVEERWIKKAKGI